jgi:integrase
MPTLKRIKTNYPGVFFIEGTSPATGKPEKIFYIRYRKAGKMIEEKAGRQFHDDMTAARAARIRAEKIEGKKLSRKEAREAAAEIKWTVGLLWQEYVHDKPATKGWTVDRYRYQKFLQPGFGAKEPKAIAQIDVHRLRINLSKILQPQTVKHVLRLLARIINFGVKKGLCAGLGFKIEFPRVNNLKTEDLTTEQMQALIEAIDQEPDIQAANFMRLVLATGMRRGEVFGLQWQDLDFERNFILLRAPKSGVDTKIPMNSVARELLSNHPRTSDFVFPGRGGRKRSRYPKAIDRIREKAGLPPDFRPLHGLRHFFASQLASSGEVDMYVLQKLLTHRSPLMTQRYSHLRDAALRRASDLVGDLLGQVVNGQKRKIANLEE